jgi:predicted AAA+ superfamily ATPase
MRRRGLGGDFRVDSLDPSTQTILHGYTPDRQTKTTRTVLEPAAGAIGETFVFAQLRHRERRAGRARSLYYGRDRTREVDFVVESAGLPTATRSTADSE